MPAFIPILETLLQRNFYYCQQLLFWFFFHAFLSSLSSVLGRGNSHRGPSAMNTVVEAWLWFCFWPKTHAQASMCELVRCPWLVFPQFCAFLANCLAQSAHNYKVVFHIDSTTLWQEFMMHHVIAYEENSEHKLHIWPYLICFFRSWLIRTLSLDDWFQCHSHTPMIHH